MAFCILPERMQDVQTYSLVFLPLTTILNSWRLGLNNLLVALLEWLTVFPEEEPFPHT